MVLEVGGILHNSVTHHKPLGLEQRQMCATNMVAACGNLNLNGLYTYNPSTQVGKQEDLEFNGDLSFMRTCLQKSKIK